MYTRSRRLLGIIVMVSTLTMVGAGTVLATGTLDQRNPGPSNADRGACQTRLAQTFTAGLSGALDTVELGIFHFQDDPGELVVTIEGANSLADPGVPDDSDVLATATIPDGDLGSSPGNVETVVFSDPATVDAGTKYAIVISAPNCVNGDFAVHFVDWGYVDASYAGGDGCFTSGNAPDVWDCGSNVDFVFATYVTTVPAPPSADVRVTVSGPASAPEGAQVTYLLTVSNLGPDTAHNVVLTAPVPGGSRYVGITTTRGTCVKPLKGPISCSLGDLANGDTTGSALTVKLTVKAGSTVTDLATASSTANNAGAATADPDTSNNWTSLATSVTGKTTGKPAH